ncbi:MAG: hypothetical protein EOL90_05090 [Spartobacteria bacterium]|nr:hypothetical protein [Spartobacteria bacterium]
MPDEILDDKQADEEFDAAWAENEPAPGAPASPASEQIHGQSPAAEPSSQPAPEHASGSPVTETDTPDDVEELRKKAHGYDSMLGRLEAERRQRKDIEERLRQLEQSRQQPAPQAPTPVSAPDAIRPEVEELQQRDPQLAALVLEDSKDGARLRKALEEFGVDAVEERAEVIRLRRDLDSKLSGIETQTNDVARQTAVQSFYAAVAAKHADWVGVATDPARAHEHQQYMLGVRSWAEGKPYAEGSRLFRIIEQGTPAEVIELLDRYKAEQPGTRVDPRASADDALAVPSRSGPPPKARAPKDDFDAGWNEAPNE